MGGKCEWLYFIISHMEHMKGGRVSFTNPRSTPAVWERNFRENILACKTETLAPRQIKPGMYVQLNSVIDMGWVPPGHTSTCGCVHVCYVCWTTSGLISDRVSVAKHSCNSAFHWISGALIIESESILDFWFLSLIYLLF